MPEAGPLEPPPENNDLGATQALLEVCSQTAGFLSVLEPAVYAGTGRGLGPWKTVEEGELVLSVPEELLLSVKTAKLDPQLAPLLAASAGAATSTPLTSEDVLAIHVLSEVSRGEGSKWAAWAATLPTSYTTLGTWPADVAARLKDSNAIAAAAVARTKVDSGFARASSVLTELFGGGGEVSREASSGDPTSSTTPGASTGASNGVSINSSGGGEQTSVHDDWNVTALAGQLGSIASWRWAYSTVSSRAMSVPWDTAGCLTPIGDLLNYTFPPATHPGHAPPGQQHGTPTLVGLAAEFERTAAGEQALTCYGVHTQLELLLHYGFILPHNPHDQLVLEPDGTPTWSTLAHARSPSDARAAREGRPLDDVVLELAVWQLLLALCTSKAALLQTPLNPGAGSTGKSAAFAQSKIDAINAAGAVNASRGSGAGVGGDGAAASGAAAARRQQRGKPAARPVFARPVRKKPNKKKV
eukprot:gene6616-26330_t